MFCKFTHYSAARTCAVKSGIPDKLRAGLGLFRERGNILPGYFSPECVVNDVRDEPVVLVSSLIILLPCRLRRNGS